MAMRAADPAYTHIRDDPIVSPSDLGLPPEMAEVLDNLTSEGRRGFVRELADALALSQRENDLRPLLAVVEKYYRTLLVRRHPKYDALRKQAANPPERPVLDVADVRKRLSS